MLQKLQFARWIRKFSTKQKENSQFLQKTEFLGFLAIFLISVKRHHFHVSVSDRQGYLSVCFWAGAGAGVTLKQRCVIWIKFYA